MTKRLTRPRAGTVMVLLLLAPGSSMPKLRPTKPQEQRYGSGSGWSGGYVDCGEVRGKLGTIARTWPGLDWKKTPVEGSERYRPAVRLRQQSSPKQTGLSCCCREEGSARTRSLVGALGTVLVPAKGR